MNYQIEIRNNYDGSLPANLPDALCEAIRATLSAQQADPASALTVVLTDNDTVQAMNQQYRDVDAPTDVLSFPAEPLPPGLADSDESVYQGDLMIAVPYATAQAERHGHDVKHSLMLLVVHGTLHLLGYDHDSDDTRAAMWQAQADVLETLGIDTAIVPALEDSEH